MSQEFQLKSIHRDAIPEALAKAERYRLLNNPIQAESICRDVLAIEPGHQDALVTLVLTITDQFEAPNASPAARTAREYAERIADPFQRAYYVGIVCERDALAFLVRGRARDSVYAGLREAMEWYERAESLSPPGNDDPILRWNSCVRTIERERLTPGSPHQELPLE